MRSGDFGLTIRRDLTLARIQDIVRNDPHASSAIDKLVDHVVGTGLRWLPRPDGAALGLTDRKALRAFAKTLAAEWSAFANDPRRFADATRRLTLNGIFRQAVRTWLTMGENALVLTLNDHPGARYRTSILTIDPDRICNPYGERDTVTRRLGVEMTPIGAPVGYWVRDAHLGDYWAQFEQTSWTFVEKETDWGRPVFVHAFEPQRDGDTRGTSPLITLIGKLRMLGRFADNELASAAINALFAATIESDMAAEEVAQHLTPASTVKTQAKNYFDTLNFFEQYPVRVGGSRVPALPPGTTMKMNSAPRQTTAFPAFETAFLQTISSKLGLAYEQVKMDWSRTNYSSARAALNEVWRGINTRRAIFLEQTVTPIHLAWADEAFDSGYLKEPAGAPKFWDAPAAYLAGAWIGPARGYVDPVKEQEGASLRVESMTSTMTDEAADQGRDIEDLLDTVEGEEEMLKERGLTRLSLVATVQSTKGPKPDSEDAVGPAGPGGEDHEGSGGGSSASQLISPTRATQRVLRRVEAAVTDLIESSH